MTHGERIWFDLRILKGEIDNGGFLQFFYNSGGDRTQGTPDTLKEVNALEILDLLQQACSVFPDSAPSPSFEERTRQMKAITDSEIEFLNSLDERFYVSQLDIDELGWNTLHPRVIL